MLKIFIFPWLENEEAQIFQQDDALLPFSNLSVSFQPNGRGEALTSLSPRSPDIMPLHLFLRVNIKSSVFGLSGHVGSVETLTHGITQATEIITPEIFHIWAKTKCHLDLCCITGDTYSGPFSIHDSTIWNSCYP
jgi:hypothetical protein